MKAKKLNILYWTFTILFSALMFMDSIGGITRAEAGQEVMRHLGYPIYVLTIFGVAKLLGAIAVVQDRFKTIKEWAYAGFTFNFLGAIASRAFVGDGAFETLFPLIGIVFLALPYYFWKQRLAVERQGAVVKPDFVAS